MSDRHESDEARRVTRRRLSVVHWIALGGLVLLVVIVSWRWQPSVERFQREVREAVPIGATQVDVEAWAARVGGQATLHHYDLALLPPEPEKTFPEIAGLSRSELTSFIEVSISWGSYRVWRDGSIAGNHMSVLMPLDPAGRVTGHHFFTLEDLAEHERQRSTARK